MRWLMAGKSRLLLVASVLLAASRVHAAFEYPVGSVPSYAKAGTVNLQHPSALDLYLNPALACGGKTGVDLYLSRLYNLEDFQLVSGAALLDRGRFSIGGGVTQLSGSDYYWERSYLIAAAVSLLCRLRAGLSVNHLRLEYADGYDGISLTSLSLGAFWTAQEKLAFGAVARNLNRPHYGSGSQSLPLTGELAVSYVFSGAFSFHLTQHLEEKVRDRVFIGQQMNLTKELTLYLGLATEPTEVGGGFSLGIGGFMFDYGFRDNVYLGGTHRFGLRFVR